ncbi:MAG: Zn-dependent hydrolase [Ignavibacteriae bacterium HGW-Ignavibacteriae-2]|jgi:L-ascorbate metabolism protein UlaG (beta-lactamase superfamily)|nr:MAG: Zn-dependent hydrolase [Ignavibacteriae bacterium HGW-Ignavibacteriae-2]
MGYDRRKFIKKGFWATLAAFFMPSLLNENDAIAAATILNYKPEPHTWSEDEINIAWLGHSTMLINIYGKIILTDPALLERVGLYFLGGSIGPSRLTPPALSVNEIPKPDIILLSHGHMDHTDYPTLSAITKKYPNQIDVVVAYLTSDIIEDLPWKSITVLDWGEKAEVQEILIKAYEVEHFGWRFPWEKDRSRGYMKDGRSYNAYTIEYNGRKILFGGDTRYSEKLNILKDENVDVALMPVGAYNPWKHAHCNPEEALKMSENFNAKYFVPMHCKTFQQGQEPFNEPIDWLKKSAPKYKIKIALEEIGQTFNLS